MKLLISFLALIAAAPSPAQDIVKERLIAPRDPLAYRATVQDGVRLFNEQKFGEAAGKFQSAVSDYPLDGLVWIYLGHSLRASGKPKEAVAAYRKGLDLKSTWQPMRTWYWMGRALLESGDKEGAYQALEHAVFQEPYVRRPDLYEDPAFKQIKAEPRFLKLVGHVDTSKMSRTQGWRTDVDYLISEIKRVNHKYKEQPLPREVTARAEALKRDVPKLTDDEIYMRMGHVLAPLNMGHTTLALFPETKLPSSKVLPVKFYAFPEGVYIVNAADDKFRDLVGAQVLKIENSSPAEILRERELHTSVENPMKIIWGAQGLAELAALRGLGVVKSGADSVKLTLKLRGGQTVVRTLPSGNFQHNRKLEPVLVANPPLFTKNIKEFHWFEKVPDVDALYVQLNNVVDDPDETLSAFGVRLRKYLAENPTKNVILDLRHNNGGNTSLYVELLRTLVAHSTKEGNRLYVIIGRMVYSAAGNLISDLERLASPVFVGEPSGGFGNQDGDESFVILPYSGIRGFLTSVWWQLGHPWDKRTSIVPDIPVQLRADAFFSGRDPVMDTIVEAIKHDKG